MLYTLTRHLSKYIKFNNEFNLNIYSSDLLVDRTILCFLVFTFSTPLPWMYSALLILSYSKFNNSLLSFQIRRIIFFKYSRKFFKNIPFRPKIYSKLDYLFLFIFFLNYFKKGYFKKNRSVLSINSLKTIKITRQIKGRGTV